MYDDLRNNRNLLKTNYIEKCSMFFLGPQPKNKKQLVMIWEGGKKWEKQHYDKDQLFR